LGSVGLDETRLVRLLRKLLCNAVKFTARGGVVVTVKGRAGTQAPWAIIVQDTGIGIAPELQAEIFEPFIQAEAGTRRSFEGAGLGLPVARRLAEAMGCTLTLDSQVGIGSRFILLLPSRPGIR
jgi:signal transduction histidine kinase